MTAATYTAFAGTRRIAAGALHLNALACHAALADDAQTPVLVFDDATGRTVELDLRGSADEVRARYAAPGTPSDVAADAVPRGRGRPKLGVVAREVTLLPRHWDWLAAQPGGASVALRKLVEAARRAGADADTRRQRQERAYHFMTTIGGDLPGFEAATRALFADDAAGVEAALADWPADLRTHALRLGFESPEAG